MKSTFHPQRMIKFFALSLLTVSLSNLANASAHADESRVVTRTINGKKVSVIQWNPFVTMSAIIGKHGGDLIDVSEAAKGAKEMLETVTDAMDYKSKKIDYCSRLENIEIRVNAMGDPGERGRAHSELRPILSIRFKSEIDEYTQQASQLRDIEKTLDEWINPKHRADSPLWAFCVWPSKETLKLSKEGITFFLNQADMGWRTASSLSKAFSLMSYLQ